MTIEFAKKHYLYWGVFEKRHRYCADRITDEQAMCYLKRYDDLVDVYGRNWKAARKHYYTIGHKENRSYICTETADPDAKNGPQPITIGKSNDSFVCEGDVHYARMSSAPVHKPNTAEAWEKVRNFGFSTVSSDGYSPIECNSQHLQDKSPMFWKQCFCEAKPKETPRFCAKQGKSCNLCDGTII